MPCASTTNAVGFPSVVALMDGNCSIFQRFDILKVLMGRLGLGLGIGLRLEFRLGLGLWSV